MGMAGGFNKFTESAKGFSKSPLGIIALFIVLVYGFASLIAGFGEHLGLYVLPLILFLCCFPVLVFFGFLWLVAKHSGKLYGPSDFVDQKDFLKYIEQGYKSGYMVGVANNKSPDDTDEARERSGSFASPQRQLPKPEEFVMPPLGDVSGKHILWVDDIPGNIQYEKEAFEALGIKVTHVLNTDAAMQALQGKTNRFDLIISDMARKEGDTEGYVLLDRVRNKGIKAPFYFYVGSVDKEQRKKWQDRGAQDATNKASTLFSLVMEALAG